jgi:hypothetical protein
MQFTIAYWFIYFFECNNCSVFYVKKISKKYMMCFKILKGVESIMCRISLSIVLVPLLLLAGCSGNNSVDEQNVGSNEGELFVSQEYLREGFIVDMDLENKRVLVVGGIKKDDVNNKSVDEILNLVKSNKGYQAIWFGVNKKQLKGLQIGDKVYVEYQYVAETDIPRSYADKIEVIND